MITTNLIQNILLFVNRLGAVHKQQVVKMFSDAEEEGVIESCIANLINTASINEHKDVLRRRNSINETDYMQQLITRAAWIVSDMGSLRVRDFFVTDYPSQIFIIGENNVCYDITVFTYDTLSSLKMTIPRKRIMLLPQGVEDECIHIALLPDKEMAKEISSLPFDSYCILNQNNIPEYHEF
ncbi:MAG: hypothetical protein IJT36_04170 [Alphaproteobacteria bacterium]|nr:hypothetical protein [Alphaproteobacteria bacterium]